MLQITDMQDDSFRITQWPSHVLLPGTKPIEPVCLDYIADVTPVFQYGQDFDWPIVTAVSNASVALGGSLLGYIVKDGADLPHDGRLYPIIGVEGLSFLYAKSHGGPHADS